MYNHVSNLPALANNSSASVFKPQLAKLACSVSVMWRSVDRLHSLMGRFSVLKYLALEPHSPPTTSAPDDIHTLCGRTLGTLSKDDDDGSENVVKKMNLRSFKLNRVYLVPLNLSNAGDFSWS